jgi:hypothetical protein
MTMPRHICEDEYEDYRQQAAEQRLIHPVLRRRYWPEPETAKCRACGQRFLLSDLSDDLLCRECDAAVLKMEEGRIP